MNTNEDPWIFPEALETPWAMDEPGYSVRVDGWNTCLSAIEANGYAIVKIGQAPPWMSEATAAEVFKSAYVSKENIPKNFWRIRE